MIHKQNCRSFLLTMARDRWPNGKMTRVGADVFQHLEVTLIRSMRDFVAEHPSVGKTLTFGQKHRKESET